MFSLAPSSPPPHPQKHEHEKQAIQKLADHSLRRTIQEGGSRVLGYMALIQNDWPRMRGP